MASLSVNQLVVASACYSRSIPQGDGLGVLIYLFNQILGTGMTPKQLTIAAECYTRSIPQGDQLGVLLYVANQILLNGGTGGGGGVATYTNLSGAAPVTTPATGSLAIDSSTGNGWVYSGSAWVRLF